MTLSYFGLAWLVGVALARWFEPPLARIGTLGRDCYNDLGRVRLVGAMAGEPDVRDTHQNLRLRAESMTRLASGGEERVVKGTVLVRAPRYPVRAYGERLTVSGELGTPPVFEGFDYRDYLAC